MFNDHEFHNLTTTIIVFVSIIILHWVHTLYVHHIHNKVYLPLKKKVSPEIHFFVQSTARSHSLLAVNIYSRQFRHIFITFIHCSNILLLLLLLLSQADIWPKWRYLFWEWSADRERERACAYAFFAI